MSVGTRLSSDTPRSSGQMHRRPKVSALVQSCRLNRMLSATHALYIWISEGRSTRKQPSLPAHRHRPRRPSASFDTAAASLERPIPCNAKLQYCKDDAYAWKSRGLGLSGSAGGGG
jgi:hypothetical protein